MEHAFRQGQQIFQQQTGNFVGEPLKSQQLLQTYLLAAGQVPQAIPPRWTSHWMRSPSPLPSRSMSPVPVVSPILAPRVIHAPNRSLSPHRVRSKSPQQPHSRSSVWFQQIPTVRMSRSGTPVPQQEEPTSPLRRRAHGKVAPQESGQQGGSLQLELRGTGQPGPYSTPIRPTRRELSPHVYEALPGRQSYPVVRSISPKSIPPQLPLQQGFGSAAWVPRPVFLHSTPQPAQPQEHMLLHSAPDYLTQTTSMPMPRSSGTPTHGVTEHFPPHSRQTLPIDIHTLQSSTDKEQMAEMLGTLWQRTSALAEDCARWNHALQERQKEATDLADMIQTLSKQFASILPQSLPQPNDQFVSMDPIHEPLTSTSETTAATAAIDQAIGILMPLTEPTPLSHDMETVDTGSSSLAATRYPQVADVLSKDLPQDLPQLDPEEGELFAKVRSALSPVVGGTAAERLGDPGSLLIPAGWEERARRPPDPVSPPAASAGSTNTHGDHGLSVSSDSAWVHNDGDEFEGMAPVTVFEDGSAEMQALVNECLMAPVHASPGPTKNLNQSDQQPVEQQAVQPLTWDSLEYHGISSAVPSKASSVISSRPDTATASRTRPQSAKVELPLERKSAPKATPKMSRPSRPSPKASPSASLQLRKKPSTPQSDGITPNKPNRSQSRTPLPKSRGPQPRQKAPQEVELEAKHFRSFLRSLSRPRSKAPPMHPPPRG